MGLKSARGTDWRPTCLGDPVRATPRLHFSPSAPGSPPTPPPLTSSRFRLSSEPPDAFHCCAACPTHHPARSPRPRSDTEWWAGGVGGCGLAQTAPASGTAVESAYTVCSTPVGMAKDSRSADLPAEIAPADRQSRALRARPPKGVDGRTAGASIAGRSAAIHVSVSGRSFDVLPRRRRRPRGPVQFG